ncbi:MAG: hypothetical protein ACYDH1_01520 [Anaerolineaceae bacterium]
MSEKGTTIKKVKEIKKQVGDLPVEVLDLVQELGMDQNSILGYQLYDYKVVVIGANGMKFSKVIG